MKSLLSWFILIVSIAVLVSSCSSSEDILPETTAPVIAEVTFVTTPTNDSTPDYTFSSDKAGTITYGGSCSSSTTSATTGDNTITLVSLSDGTYSNCTIIVTDSAGNASSSLTMNSFVVDTTSPTVSSTSPSNSASSVSIGSTISVTFSESIDNSSVTANTSNTTCSESMQLSSNNFSSCIQMSSTPSASNTNKTFSVTPSDNLSSETSYKIRVTTLVKDVVGNSMSNSYTTSNGFTSADVTAPILSQVTAITTPDNDTTPSYTFSSNEAGSITYGGSCTSSTTSASSGNNSITFSTLSNGTYDNCTVMVTDNASNSSSSLSITRFIVNDISKESSASDNATVGFGQTYQYQFDTSGTYSGAVTYSLSNEPDNMTISSSGLVEWTPTKAYEIKTHDNITITLTTASGFVLTEAYDLAVTGTCVSGNVMSIWSGDQRTSIDSSKFLGNITAYTDNSSSVKTATANYGLSGSSVHLTHGPTATVNDGAVFFYNRYTDNDTIYLFYFFGMDVGGASNKVSIDVFVSNNASQDGNPVDDDANETDQESQSQSATTGLWTSSYTGRYAYGANSDGAVIGPFSNTDNQTLLDNGTTFKIFIDMAGTSSLRTSATPGRSTALTLGDLDSMKYYSKDNSSVSLGNQDNFTIGYKTRITCE